VLEIDFNRNPELADNIWNAQRAHHPAVLTYGGPAISPGNRQEAMHYEDPNGISQEIMRILSRDEYPFACTLEGGKSPWVGHIPGKENSSQGGLISAFLRKYMILPTTATAPQKEQEKSKFEVRVTNHPRGPV